MNFRSFLFSSACTLALCAGHAHAASDTPVMEFDSVQAFRDWAGGVAGSEIQAVTSFHLAAYYCDAPEGYTGTACPADGGEGLFVQKDDTDHCAASSDDGGSVLVEAKGTIIAPENYCFVRQNLNGDIRQFGVTPGSEFDCTAGPSCEPITAGTTDHPSVPWTSLVAAAHKEKLVRLTTAGVPVRISSTITIDDGMELDLGGANVLANRDTLLGVPGTVFIDHTEDPEHPNVGTTTVLMKDHTSLHNGLLLSSAYTAPPSSIVESYGRRDDMIERGDTGLTCDGAGCEVHVVEIDGFDTAYDAKGSYNRATDVVADGNVCFYVHDSGGGTKWTGTQCGGDFTRGPGLDSNVESFKVTHLGADSGVCNVTVEDLPGASAVADITEGFLIWGSGAITQDGGVNINDRFRVGPVAISGGSRTFDLIGSKCTDDSGYLDGPAPTASWKINDNKIVLDAGETFDQIHPGMIIRGVAGI